jgi:DNA polymerase
MTIQWIRLKVEVSILLRQAISVKWITKLSIGIARIPKILEVNAMSLNCVNCFKQMANNKEGIYANKTNTPQVMWVGLSAKPKGSVCEVALSPTTRSGQLIQLVETNCDGISTHKTNLVNFAPLDEHNKLRYPNTKEIDQCFPEFKKEMDSLDPKIVFLLGGIVTKAISRHMNLPFENWEGYDYKFLESEGIIYIPIHHPSYIYVYKRKEVDDYVGNITKLIYSLI